MSWILRVLIYIALHLCFPLSSQINDGMISSVNITPLNMHKLTNSTGVYSLYKPQSSFLLHGTYRFSVSIYLYPMAWLLTNKPDSILTVIFHDIQPLRDDANQEPPIIICISDSNKYISIFLDPNDDALNRIYPSSQSNLASGNIQDIVNEDISQHDLRNKVSDGTSFNRNKYIMEPELSMDTFPLMIRIINEASHDTTRIVIENNDINQSAQYSEVFDIENGIHIFIGNADSDNAALIPSVYVDYQVIPTTEPTHDPTTTMTTASAVSTVPTITDTAEGATASSNATTAITTVYDEGTTDEPHDIHSTYEYDNADIHTNHLHFDPIMFMSICVCLCCCGIFVGCCCNKMVKVNKKKKSKENVVVSDETHAIKAIKTPSELNRDIMNDIKDVMNSYISPVSSTIPFNNERNKDGFVELQLQLEGGSNVPQGRKSSAGMNQEAEGQNVVDPYALPQNTATNAYAQQKGNDDAESGDDNDKADMLFVTKDNERQNIKGNDSDEAHMNGSDNDDANSDHECVLPMDINTTRDESNDVLLPGSTTR